MTNQIPVRQNDQKKIPRPCLPSRGSPAYLLLPRLGGGPGTSGGFPAPFSLGKVVRHALPADPWPAIFNVPPGEGGPWYFGRSSAPVSQRDEVRGVTPFPWSYYSTRRGFCQDFFSFFFFLFPEGRGLVAPADGGYPPPLLPQCGIEGGETRQPVLPHTGFTGPQASEEVPMEPDVFNFHGSDLLCFTVVIILRATGFVKPFF